MVYSADSAELESVNSLCPDRGFEYGEYKFLSVRSGDQGGGGGGGRGG